jgi:hypothetical protein
MRIIYRILLRLSIVLGLLASAILVVSAIVNHEAVLGSGAYSTRQSEFPTGIREDKDGSLVTHEIPIDRTKKSWHDAALAGCNEAAGTGNVFDQFDNRPWCNGDPVPDLATFKYCTESTAPAWCHGVEKIVPDRRVPTADMPSTSSSATWAPPETDFQAARREAIFSAFFVPGLIGSAALGVLALAWIIRPEKSRQGSP